MDPSTVFTLLGFSNSTTKVTIAFICVGFLLTEIIAVWIVYVIFQSLKKNLTTRNLSKRAYRMHMQFTWLLIAQVSQY